MADQLTSLDARHCSDDATGMTVNSVNFALLDPAKWGWSVGGGIADLLTPQDVRIHESYFLCDHVTSL